MLAAHGLGGSTQDMETDLITFDDFFGAAMDEMDEEMWTIPREPLGCEDHDLLDAETLQPLDSDEDTERLDACRLTDPPIKSEPPHSLQTASWIDTQAFLVKDEVKQELTLVERRKAMLADITPTFTSSPRAKRRISEANMITEDEQELAEQEAGLDEGEEYDEEEYEDGDCDCEHDCEHGCGEEEAEEEIILPDTPDYAGMPLLSDDDVAALVPSPTNSSRALCSSESISSTASAANSITQAATPSDKQVSLSGTDPSSVVTEEDIPDVVTLFNSLYSPSTSPTREAQTLAPAPLSAASATVTTPHSAPLRIVVPAPQPGLSSSAPMPGSFPLNAGKNHQATGTPSVPASSAFNYFTPPGFITSAPGSNHSFILAAATVDSLSPALKASLLQGSMSAAAAMAAANSAAAINTIRKLNATYGVPIAPLHRSLTGSELPLKPKLMASSSAPRISATAASGGKVTKISITPDIADFKLVQIFHHFCDPMTKMLTQPRFHQLLLHHQVKDEGGSGTTAAGAAKPSTGRSTPSATAASTTSATNPSAPPVPTAAGGATSPGGAAAIATEARHLFRLMDPSGSGVVDLERFMSSFQICNRCTEAKRRAHSALCAQQGQSFVPPTALERQLMEDVAPVIVRVVPTAFEGSKVRSCEHYQWTWCEGFDKTGNEKCRGTNRHDKCPKYLANCTLWKHKLPPKTRKPRAATVAALGEVLDSPSKKLKHFG